MTPTSLKDFLSQHDIILAADRDELMSVLDD